MIQPLFVTGKNTPSTTIPVISLAEANAATGLSTGHASAANFLRMVREFPNMAVSIMRELAHRLELTNQQLRTALSELRELRGGTARARPDADAAE